MMILSLLFFILLCLLITKILIFFVCLVDEKQRFWPSIVMNKWLNIKPKLYDFSEDEIDTEPESEDESEFY